MADPKEPKDTTAQAIVDGIERGMLALAKSLKPQDDLDRAGISQERKDQLRALPQSQRYRDIPWRSAETGATGVAHVVASKAFPNGRIQYLIGYTHPREAYTQQNEGGRVPDGFHIWDKAQVDMPPDGEPANGTFNPHFLQWRWENFLQADLRRYAGIEMQGHFCQHPDGLKTPWLDSRVGSIDNAAA